MPAGWKTCDTADKNEQKCLRYNCRVTCAPVGPVVRGLVVLSHGRPKSHIAFFRPVVAFRHERIMVDAESNTGEHRWTQIFEPDPRFLSVFIRVHLWLN